jgi:type IV fimbrial biogenesis protein FimT
MSISLSLPTNQARGFTLVELMVVLALLAILAMMAVPSFNSTVSSVRLSGAANDLMASIQQARATAMRFGQRVTICATTNGTTCSQANTWSQGWITFLDRPGSTLPLISTGETVTAVVSAMPDSLIVSTSGTGPMGDVSYLSFSADGTSRQLNGNLSMSAESIRICSTMPGISNDARSRDLVMNKMGRVVIRKQPGVDVACTKPDVAQDAKIP